ncbi:MAG: DNA polymerase zeta [Thelocarpon superellum]|nr:MAG: DNA polymerase zeta [Thelocarpon superellum]
MDPFRVRLNCVDHYQALPTPLDPLVPARDGPSPLRSRPRVPVIRVFGATPTGQKVCAHIHGALPYVYVEYDGSLAPDDVDVYCHRLQLSIDHALAVSFRRQPQHGPHHFVARVTLVKGVPFYGFHVGYRCFLKIYLLDPAHVTRMADVLRQGTVMNRVFQPYESHLQYLLQWMCDYNLYGCAYLDCRDVRFRQPVPRHEELASAHHRWHDRAIRPGQMAAHGVPRQSHCALEVDLCVHDILNRHEIQPRALHHDFVERAHPWSREAKLVPSMAGLWRDETRRRKAKMSPVDPDSSPFPPEVLVSMSADERASPAAGWLHEPEFRARLAELVVAEREEAPLSFEGFVVPPATAHRIRTTFESVEDLYPAHCAAPSEASGSTEDSRGADAARAIEVDESRIARVGDELSEDESDDEIARQSTRSSRGDGDVADGPHDAAAFSPASASQLADLGIRAVTERAADAVDVFEIPIPFTSELAPAAMSADAAATSRRPKKRRIFRDQAPTAPPEYYRQRQVADPPLFLPGLPAEVASPRRMFPDPTAGARDETRAATPAAPAAPAAPSTTPSSVSHSQRTLPFAVVKDPRDPTTVLRASQRSMSAPARPGTRDLAEPDRGLKDASASTASRSTSSAETGSGVASPMHDVAAALPAAFGAPPGRDVWCLAPLPPTSAAVVATFAALGLPTVVYQEAYYSNERDVPDRPRSYAGREFRLESRTLPFLPPFDAWGTARGQPRSRPSVARQRKDDAQAVRRRRRECTLRGWEMAAMPPTYREVEEWCRRQDQISVGTTAAAAADDAQDEPLPAADRGASQMDGPTQARPHGLPGSAGDGRTSVQHEVQYMSVMSLEVHVNTRGDLRPNPDHDPVACVFWCLQADDGELDRLGRPVAPQIGIIALEAGDGHEARGRSQHGEVPVAWEATELDLFQRVIDVVRRHDPDILTGYEVHDASWGYLIERARAQYDVNLCDEFSRMKAQSHGRFGKEQDRWGFNHTSTIRVTGRHMINIWRAMRGELNLRQYTMENVVVQVLRQRIPHYAARDLTRWYQSARARDRARVWEYFVRRVQLDLAILERNELIARTSEQARLLGVDFYSVMARGSQFKVESLMFRLAKAESLVLVSPSRQQVGRQNALECLPLVMEPRSDFYTSPVVVLDFQSLYPSIMIAYNYCYSTFLGRLVPWRGANKMGFAEYARRRRLLELLRAHITIAPNGMMYVRPAIRKSLLAKMLGEILETRVMVKSGMKQDRADGPLQRLLNHRQLALKLIANVTYGYTSASFSGRLPCAEIADSIVQTARETLERAIALIHGERGWGAEVVYGDTDSLFIVLPGRSRAEAFQLGQDMARAVTAANPRPVKLKFEKVYLPCVLLAKKRYVGFKYESAGQAVPTFDAKGIETVRRDGTPAAQKMEEATLKILFRTADLSQVKRYVQRQCRRILRGQVSVQDFCFAKEVRLGTYSERAVPPPGALISTRRMLHDPRAEPQYGERVPYVVITGAPGARLMDRCVAPSTLLGQMEHELDAEYYITKHLLPPLERIFNLVGANVRRWYDEMPKEQRLRAVARPRRTGGGPGPAGPQRTLEAYLRSSRCLLCRTTVASDVPVCAACLEQADRTSAVLQQRLTAAARRERAVEQVCRSCAGLAFAEEVRCDSLDCPVFYTRTRQRARREYLHASTDAVLELLDGMNDGLYDW